jgi:Fe-S-cluster-containing dehydrogenase component
VKKWNLVIDVAKCFNCHCCTLACHDEYHGNDFPGYAASMPKHGQNWIRIAQRETGAVPMVEVAYLPTTCNHCDDAPCVKAGRDGAVVKRDDGIVIIVPGKARGQRQIVDACPYGAVTWNEELQLPQAWPFDAHLIDRGWKRTRGAQACPTQAMRSILVDDEEMRRIVDSERLEVLHPEYGTRPRVWYRNLDRFRTLFIGGSVAGEIAGTLECIEGAQAVLEHAGRAVATARTDTWGDVKFSGLEPGSGPWRLTIADERFAPKTIEVRLGEASVYLGEIRLAPRGAAAPSTAGASAPGVVSTP